MSDNNDGTNKGKSIKDFFNAASTGKQSSKSLGTITARYLLKLLLTKAFALPSQLVQMRSKITDHKPAFEDFVTAVCLVGLVQVSSASVERLFSQLKLVVNLVGQSMLEETLEARLFVLENMIPNGVYLS
jgi:hypothetical protein